MPLLEGIVHPDNIPWEGDDFIYVYRIIRTNVKPWHHKAAGKEVVNKHNY